MEYSMKIFYKLELYGLKFYLNWKINKKDPKGQPDYVSEWKSPSIRCLFRKDDIWIEEYTQHP